MKLSAKSTPPVLYVFRDKTSKEVMAATFSSKAASALDALRLFSLEEHEAKTVSTKGMYGKLFGLSGVQRRGADAVNKNMTSSERSARASAGGKARWASNKTSPRALGKKV